MFLETADLFFSMFLSTSFSQDTFSALTFSHGMRYIVIVSFISDSNVAKKYIYIAIECESWLKMRKIQKLPKKVTEQLATRPKFFSARYVLKEVCSNYETLDNY